MDTDTATGTRWDTPTGEPCPRAVRLDGTIEGAAHCVSCSCCLLLLRAAWPDAVAGASTETR